MYKLRLSVEKGDQHNKFVRDRTLELQAMHTKKFQDVIDVMPKFRKLLVEGPVDY